MGFDSFIGNASIVQRLSGKLRSGRFPHALIFSGPDGVGKRTFALMLAKALNCVEPDGADFCDHCAQCRKINAGTHPDVALVTIEEEASEIKIAQIRQVLRFLDLQPLEGANKVFIVDPADEMNIAAANALLKGLEEPPANSFFILLTANVHELLITVRSRSQVYHFAPLTLEEIRKQGITDELIVRWSQGSIGRARSLQADALKEQRELLLDFLETSATVTETEFREMFSASADIARSKTDYPNYLAILTVLVADLLYLKTGASARIVNIDIQSRLEKLGKHLSLERVIAIGEFVNFIETALKNYVNRQMLTDVLALTASGSAEKILHDNSRESR